MRSNHLILLILTVFSCIETESWADSNNPLSACSLTIDPFVEMAFGKTIGVDENYASIGVLITSFQKDCLYYAEGSWSRLFDGENGLSCGLGVRFGDPCRGCGSFLYYDGRTLHDHYFNQVSFGIEGWIFPWSVHLNLGIPFETFIDVNRTSCSYPGGYKLCLIERAYACNMATLFAGRDFDLCNRFLSDLCCSLFVGPYWLSHKEHDNCYGGGAIIDLHFHDLLSWRTVFSYDEVFKARLQTILQVDIPLQIDCRCESTSCSNPRPLRFPLIPLDVRCITRQNWSRS